jgi:predicted nicotinamide N-methyase
MGTMIECPAGPEAFVRGNATLRSVPHVPEIRLYLSDDALTLWEETERELRQPDQPPPFWAFAWPGGQALARYILDHADLVRGRTILDLGSGSGLTAIAAAMAGASAVLASELDPFAIAAIELNASANDVAIAVTADVLDGSGEDAEVILAADVCYETTMAKRVLSLLERARARGADVLIGDPGRAFLPRHLLRELDAHDVPVLADLENAPVKRVMILTLA